MNVNVNANEYMKDYIFELQRSSGLDFFQALISQLLKLCV